MTLTPVPNLSGTATITLTVTDGNGSSASNSFLFVVAAVNDAPTLAAIGNVNLLEDAGPQVVNLSGITSGATNESNPLTVTAVSSNPGLIPNPAVTYPGSGASGSLAFTPVANANGTATISVVVNDGQFQNNTVTQTFLVTVTAVNDTPTLDPLPNLTFNENAGLQTVNLTGISSGALNEGQTLTITAVSSNTTVITNVTVAYTSANPSGTLSFRTATNASGSAVLAVTVMDNGGTANSAVDKLTRIFTVTVNATNTTPPVLRIEPAGTNVAVSWPSSSSGFTLQSKPTLATNQVWTTVTPSPVLTGGRFWVTNAPAGAAKFYRLIKP